MQRSWPRTTPHNRLSTDPLGLIGSVRPSVSIQHFLSVPIENSPVFAG
jgi:hypothetical protein